jgi:ribosomal-protein-alanine N-acetyltransferase
MIELNLNPFPNLQTERCNLRKLTVNDKREILISRSDKEIIKYLDIIPATSIDDAVKFIEKILDGLEKNEWIYWAINLKGDLKCIGTICLWNFSKEKSSADVGFLLLNEYQKQGLMSEVIPIVLEYGFNSLHLNKIEGEVAPKNENSIRILKRFGFSFSKKLENTDIYKLEKSTYLN